MIYAQFYQLSTGYVVGSLPPRFDESAKRPIEAVGSDSVYLMDGRFGRPRMHQTAMDVCKARGFIGYRLFAGESFTRSRPIDAGLTLA